MKNSSYEIIVNILYQSRKKALTKQNINDRKQFYYERLKKGLELYQEDFEEKIDINSPEIAQIVINEFLSIDIPRPQIFEPDGYIPWLDAARDGIKSKFYDRYEKYLLQIKKWSPESISNIASLTDTILDHIANPKSEKCFSKKGLVLGDIQSGKTANYTGLINKAIDAGYKLIIVLAGLTRDLRNQTQNRLDKEVIGRVTKYNSMGETIGVGLISYADITSLTCSDDEKNYGDIKKYFLQLSLSETAAPTIAVVKKNTSTLSNLYKFITSSPKNCYSNGKLDIPVLIIDDEVDQASVNVKQGDCIDDASTINRKIRTIISALNRCSYVGYTATPFANVFINPEVNQDEIGDLYPKDFIISMPANKGYCGIKEYFGLNDDLSELDEEYSSDLFVDIEQFKGVIGRKMRVDSTIDKLDDSLSTAIKYFVLASAIKRQRNIVQNNSMLIHIARFKKPATSLKPVVLKYLNSLYYDIKFNSTNSLKTWQQIWEKYFKPVSQNRLKKGFADSWNEISKYIKCVIESAKTNTLVLNGDYNDILEYSEANKSDYIIIGGDKLSRGLTLEGLLVSYYDRNSNAYDSLLQMARWFGYRNGWLDLCRVFTRRRYMNNFIRVGKAIEQFRKDLQIMNSQRLNPREVGQRIMYSPCLIPTSRNKMRNAKKVKISFSNSVQQIITFDKKTIKDNLTLTNSFISKLKNPILRKNRKIVFKNVDVSTVLKYLESYKECSLNSDATQISIKNWINYIEKLNKVNELNNWTIVLHSLSKPGPNLIKIANFDVYKPSRTLRYIGNAESFKYFDVKVNSDPSDFKEIFDEGTDEYETIKSYDPSKKYKNFTANDALLVIYVVDLYERETNDESKNSRTKYKPGKKIVEGSNVCAPAIWFPPTLDYENSATMYYANKDYLNNDEAIKGDNND